VLKKMSAFGLVVPVWFCCLLECCIELPITLLSGADLGITSPAAALSLVVPPFVFQFVQQALFIQF